MLRDAIQLENPRLDRINRFTVVLFVAILTKKARLVTLLPSGLWRDAGLYRPFPDRCL
jgi:hypothetical protein